jgi:hypothetical protein
MPGRALPAGLGLPHKHQLHGLPERLDHLIDGRHQPVGVSHDDAVRCGAVQVRGVLCHVSGWALPVLELAYISKLYRLPHGEVQREHWLDGSIRMRHHLWQRHVQFIRWSRIVQ